MSPNAPPASVASPHASVNLEAIARRALVESGFVPDFSDEVRAELAKLVPLPATTGIRDLRSLLWSSIDNEESRDLDQIEVAREEPSGAITLLLGIADVDAQVPRGSALDQRAAVNTTSVYAGVEVFPMLPEALSTGLTSLNAHADRLAIVTEYSVEKDGRVGKTDIYRALVRNQAKLSYEALAPWLTGTGSPPATVTTVPGLEQQLKLQDEAAQRLLRLRQQHGALDLDSSEARPVMADGKVVDFVMVERSRSRELIENLMIAANGVMGSFLRHASRSMLARVVRTPTRWPRIIDLARSLKDSLPSEPDPAALSAFLARRKAADPSGFAELSLAVVKLLGPGEYVLERSGEPPALHFGLAMNDYTHSTAPNRRFPDLVTQRLLKAILENAPAPYSDDALEQIASRTNLMEASARKIERLMRKVAAAVLLQPRVGESFDSVVTGVSPKGTFVRLTQPPAEGRVVRGEEGLDVGDRVRVKLVSTDAQRGFLDFVRER